MVARCQGRLEAAEPGMSSTASLDPEATYKKQAAEYAVRYIESGMTVGLGTGSLQSLPSATSAHCCNPGS